MRFERFNRVQSFWSSCAHTMPPELGGACALRWRKSRIFANLQVPLDSLNNGNFGQSPFSVHWPMYRGRGGGKVGRFGPLSDHGFV